MFQIIATSIILLAAVIYIGKSIYNAIRGRNKCPYNCKECPKGSRDKGQGTRIKTYET